MYNLEEGVPVERLTEESIRIFCESVLLSLGTTKEEAEIILKAAHDHSHDHPHDYSKNKKTTSSKKPVQVKKAKSKATKTKIVKKVSKK